MPDYSEISGKKRVARGKGRGAIATVSDWEKRTHRASLNLSIEKKVVDGKTVTAMRCEDYGPASTGEKVPMVKEFTSVEEFTKYVSEKIAGIEKAL